MNMLRKRFPFLYARVSVYKYNRGGNVKKNILFIMVDALRADKSYFDNRTVVTPSIDSLKVRGTIFTQAFATTSTTTPSLASMFTGYYPSTHGIRSLVGYKLRKGIVTLAQILKDSGYNTYAMVTGPLLRELGLDRGFDHYDCRDESEGAHTIWGEDLLETISKKGLKEPWFLFIHFWELHIPRWVPPEYDNVQFGSNVYERALSGLDFYLGRLLAQVPEDTLIILTGDHGEKIGDSRWVARRSRVEMFLRKIVYRLGLKKRPQVGHGFHVYDYLMHVPLIFVGEPFPASTAFNDQVSHVDLLPTLVEALGLKYQVGDLDGRSLMPLLRGQKMMETPIIFEACGYALKNKYNWLAGIRTSEYKYVYRPYSDSVEEELYDLITDPNETMNLSENNREKAQKMRELLESRYRRVGDEFAIKTVDTIENDDLTKEEEEKILTRLKDLGYVE